jgi:hypothetical protein
LRYTNSETVTRFHERSKVDTCPKGETRGFGWRGMKLARKLKKWKFSFLASFTSLHLMLLVRFWKNSEMRRWEAWQKNQLFEFQKPLRIAKFLVDFQFLQLCDHVFIAGVWRQNLLANLTTLLLVFSMENLLQDIENIWNIQTIFATFNGFSRFFVVSKSYNCKLNHRKDLIWLNFGKRSVFKRELSVSWSIYNSCFFKFHASQSPDSSQTYFIFGKSLFSPVLVPESIWNSNFLHINIHA